MPVSRMKDTCVERRGAVVLVGELQGQHRPGDADEGLADDLALGVEPEGALLGDLDVVVEEADDPQPDHEVEQEQPRGVGQPAGGEVGDGVAEHGGGDDDDPAHGGRAALGEVRRRAVLADELPVVLLHEQPDEQRGAQQREHERDGARDEDGHHAGITPSAAALRQQRVGQAPDARAVRALEQDGVTGPQHGRRGARGRRRRRGPRGPRCAPPAPRAPAASGAVPAPTASEHVHAQARGVGAHGGVLGGGVLPQLEHLAEHRDPAGGARSAGPARVTRARSPARMESGLAL